MSSDSAELSLSLESAGGHIRFQRPGLKFSRSENLFIFENFENVENLEMSKKNAVRGTEEWFAKVCGVGEKKK